MTHDTKRARRLAPLPVATLAALLLAGCSSGNVGDSWQCPLAAGGSCDSVAAADPAVPDPRAGGPTILADPLWRVRGGELPETPPVTDCATACGEEFDLFAWLARLSGGGESANHAAPGDAMAGAAGPSTARTSAPGDAVGGVEPAASSTAPAGTEPGAEDLATAVLEAEPEAAEEDPAVGALRTGEVVARIWIAPFVDADGVYREASHVRVVLEPAGWRLK